MPLIRTPAHRFNQLPGYPFAPHYVNIGDARIPDARIRDARIRDARMHYVDEGQGDPILCLHGEPTWSFLYRKMIPPLAGVARVLAPDFLGFGKSDKFTEQRDYSFQMHRDALVSFIETLDLRDITVVVQDWGGLVGLRVATEMPERFARLVILNTFLPTGEEEPPRAFKVWRAFVARKQELNIGSIIQSSTVSDLPDDVLRGYDAPFPDAISQAGALAWPLLVPLSATDPGADSMQRARAVLREWQKPALVMFSDKDPILGGAHSFFRQLIPTAGQTPTITIQDAGHFLQEDKGEEIAAHIMTFLSRP